jgi:hypothetical protein
VKTMNVFMTREKACGIVGMCLLISSGCSSGGTIARLLSGIALNMDFNTPLGLIGALNYADGKMSNINFSIKRKDGTTISTQNLASSSSGNGTSTATASRVALAPGQYMATVDAVVSDNNGVAQQHQCVTLTVGNNGVVAQEHADGVNKTLPNTTITNISPVICKVEW